MRILVIANVGVFPSRVCPVAGIFFGNLLDRLAPLVEKIVVVSPRPWAPRYLPYVGKRLGRVDYSPVERRGRILVARPKYLPLHLRRRLNWLSYAMYHGSRGLARRLHGKHRFDVVLGYGFPHNAYTAVRVAEEIARPSVTFSIGSDVNVHALHSRGNMAVTKETIRRSSLVLTDSKALTDRIGEYCPDARNVMPYYMGIDLGFLDESTESREQLRERFRIAPGNKCLVTVGRLVRTKGIWEFLEAFKVLTRKYENLRGIMAGGGPELETLRQAIEQAGLGHRLKLTGLVDRVEIGRLLKAADLMLFPTHHEGVPDTVKEALAAELPVVVTDVDGNPEIVEHERTGLLVPCKDVPAMVNAVCRMLDHPDFARRTALAGKRLVLEKFDADKNVNLLRDMLQQLVEDPANAGCRIAADRRELMDGS